jgi:hypothetical protein
VKPNLLGALALGAACTALAWAPAAHAHTLTKKKARAALGPVAAQTAPKVAAAIAGKLPGATVAESAVGPCVIAKRGHRAECVLAFRIEGVSTGETECALDAVVRFRSRRSRQLRTSVGPTLACLFPVPLK